MMKADPGSLIVGVVIASAIAGPVYLLTVVLTSLYLTLPEPIIIPSLEVGGLLLAVFALSVIIGFFVSVAFNSVGAIVMSWIGRRLEFARLRLCWMVVGGLSGAACVAAMGEARSVLPAPLVALVITSAICAGVCHRCVKWTHAA